MSVFISGEYIVAKKFMELGRNDSQIAVRDLSVYGIKLQQEANKQNLDLVFMNGRRAIMEAVANYGDYFKYNEKLDVVSLAHNKDLSDIEYHFMAYLPEIVINLKV